MLAQDYRPANDVWIAEGIPHRLGMTMVGFGNEPSGHGVRESGELAVYSCKNEGGLSAAYGFSQTA